MKMNQLSKTLLLCIAPTFFITNVYAAGFQKFYNIAYDNPANLKSVKKADIIVGDTYLNTRYIFRGFSNPLSGTAISHEVDNYPYGRIAYRIRPDFVIGLDITHLGYTNIQYPVGSVLQRVSTATIVKSTAVIPRASYQINKKLAIGAGLTINKMTDIALDFVVPPITTSLTNRGGGWGLGWNLGLAYTLTPKTEINLSYYSKIMHNIQGTSTWGGITNQQFQFIRIPLPAVISLGLNQVVTDKFALNTLVRFQWWNVYNYLVLQNTALSKNITLTQKYSNSWIVIITGRYKFTDKFAGLLGGEYDSNPLATPNRSAGLPTYKLYAAIIGGEYAFTKSFSTKFVYARSISNPPINRVGASGLTVGRVNIQGNVADLSFIWHM